MPGHMIEVYNDGLGPIYVDPKTIASAYPISAESSHRHDAGYVLQGVHGSRFTLTTREWEQVKPDLVTEQTDLQAALETAINEGKVLAEKLRDAEKRIAELVQAWKPTLSPENNPEYDWRLIGKTYIPYCKTCGQNIVYCVCRPVSKPTTEFQQVSKADVDEAIRRADALKAAQAAQEAPRVIITQAPPAPAPLDNRILYSRIVTRVKRTTFKSKTSNSERPQWSLFCVKGTQVNVFDHADPLRDHKPLLQEAGYLEIFQAMQKGETAYWDEHPIQIAVTPSGKFWDIVSIVPRADGAVPNEADEGLSPAQVKVCEQAKEMLERDDLVVFDIESTGLDDDDEVVEIAGILLDPTHPALSFETLVKPTDLKLLHRPGKKGRSAFDIHGIGEQLLKDAPKMGDPEVLNLLSEFMDKKAWASFNIEFDERLLYQGLNAVGIHDGFPEGRKNFCIQQMMNLYLGHEYVSLDEACKALGVERSAKHRAMADAEDALKILKVLAAKALSTVDVPF